MSPTRRSPRLAALLLGLAATLASAEVVEIDSREFEALLARGVPVVDLRTGPEWKETGVVRGSHLLTLYDAAGRSDPAAWMRQVDKVAAADKPVVLICRSGNRSGKAAQLLQAAGRKGKVYNVRTGITGWVRDGRPVLGVADNLKLPGVTCPAGC